MGHEGTLKGDKNILYFHLGGGLMGVYACEMSSHCTLKICAFYLYLKRDINKNNINKLIFVLNKHKEKK